MTNKIIVKHLQSLVDRMVENDFSSNTEDRALAEAIQVIQAQRELTPEACRHISIVIDYNWRDELEDFQEHSEIDGVQDCHVFSSLVFLDNLVNGTNVTPEEYVTLAHGETK
jgi:hypothetical protein